jgi:hypothetical protein
MWWNIISVLVPWLCVDSKCSYMIDLVWGTVGTDRM